MSLRNFLYGQGNFVMDVILPEAGNNLETIMPLVNDAGFTTWISQMNKRKIDLSFPKFKYGFKIKLKDILTDMGMGIAFHDGADFSNISDQYDLLINEVTHQSFIETNEEGTEAAAATVVEIGVTSIPLPSCSESRSSVPVHYPGNNYQLNNFHGSGCRSF